MGRLRKTGFGRARAAEEVQWARRGQKGGLLTQLQERERAKVAANASFWHLTRVFLLRTASNSPTTGGQFGGHGQEPAGFLLVLVLLTNKLHSA